MFITAYKAQLLCMFITAYKAQLLCMFITAYKAQLLCMFITAYKAQFTAFIDKNNDGRATFHEIKSYLKKYDHDVTDERVKAFLERRDSNGNIILYKSDIV
jgi:Ca2+-binding EF-hand superfamily protein